MTHIIPFLQEISVVDEDTSTYSVDKVVEYLPMCWKDYIIRNIEPHQQFQIDHFHFQRESPSLHQPSR